MAGKRLFISTTNGTRALQRVEEAPHVITSALINRASAVKYLLDTQPDTVWILGSGWEGGYSLEDTCCAGAIAHALTSQSKEVTIGNDEVLAAIALYSQWQDDLLGMFHSCSHGQRLLRLNCQEDLKYCAQIDSFDILPIQKEPGILVKY
jgi:2-phosphosulfolactate phosphatase